MGKPKMLGCQKPLPNKKADYYSRNRGRNRKSRATPAAVSFKCSNQDCHVIKELGPVRRCTAQNCPFRIIKKQEEKTK